MKQGLTRIIYIALAMSFLLGEANAQIKTYTAYEPNPVCYPGLYDDDSTPAYTYHDYDYQFKNYGRYSTTAVGYHYTHPYRLYSNFEDFNGGISSYQGTSTGPGPNGGYPGSPRGTYKTYYNAAAHPINYDYITR